MSRAAALRLCNAATGFTVGSGVAIGNPALLLTCAHVLTGVERIDVLDAKGVQIGNVEVGAFLLDLDHDLALAKIDWSISPQSAAIRFGTPVGPVSWSGYPHEELGLRGILVGEGTVAVQSKVQLRSRVVPVFQLLGSPALSPGMSGGPLFEDASGAVVGLCAAEFTEVIGGSPARVAGFAGFALPLPESASELALLLSGAEEAVPRFGPCPNLAAAQELVQEAGLRASSFAGRNLDYDETRTVARLSLSDAIGDFIGSPCTVMPLLGESGVGKTTFLLDLLKKTERPCLFLRCAELAPAEDINAMVTKSLGLDRPSAPAACASDFSIVANRMGPGLLLLDGLNELPQVVDWSGRFLGRELVTLLAPLGWKVVVTCRPDAWRAFEATFQRDALYLSPYAAGETDRGTEAVPTELGDFSPGEVEAYLSTRGVSAASNLRHTRNPLTLSLAVQRGPTAAKSLQLDDLLKLLLDEHVRRLAGTRGSARVASIRSLCVKLAGALLFAGRTEIALSDVPLDSSATFEGLIEQGVLIPAGSDRWRYRYDQMLEHLQAELVSDPAAAIAHSQLVDPHLEIPIPPSVLVAAVRRQSAAADRSALHRSLQAAAANTPSSIQAINLFARILKSAALSDEDLEVLDAALGRYADPAGLRQGLFVGGFADPPWRSLAVGFSILRAYALANEGYGWRLKDVSHGTYVAMNAGMLQLAGIGTFLKGALHDDRDSTVAVLEAWLNDPTRMQGIEGTLSSWTLNLIDIYKLEIGETAALAMASKAGSAATDALVSSLTRTEGFGLASLEELAESTSMSPSDLLRAVGTITDAANALESMDGQIADRLAKLLGEPYEEPSLNGWRLTLLADLPGYADAAWQACLKEIEADRTTIGSLGRFLAERPDEVLPFLKRRSQGPDEVDEITSVISNACPKLIGSTDRSLIERWGRQVEFMTTLIPRRGANFRYHVESLLLKMDLKLAEATGLLDLTLTSVKECDESFANNLRYSLCGRGRDSFAERKTLERYLCRRIVEIGPPHAAIAIIDGLEETISERWDNRTNYPDDFLALVDELRTIVRSRSDVSL